MIVCLSNGQHRGHTQIQWTDAADDTQLRSHQTRMDEHIGKCGVSRKMMIRELKLVHMNIQYISVAILCMSVGLFLCFFSHY